MAAAVDHVLELDGVDPDQVVTLGHSAGGHLAAWVAARQGTDLPGGVPRVRVRATVPQAGVLDLRTAATTRLGGTAVPDLVGGMPARLAGDDAELVEVPGDHFALIDPSTPAWSRAVKVLGTLTSG